MEENKNLIQTNWADLGQYFSGGPSFIAGIIFGFFTGIASGFIANILFKKYEQRKYKKTGYITLETSGGMLTFEGKIENNTTTQRALNTLTKQVK